MAIDFSKYVDITSGVGGTGGVASRDLIGRIFTPNLYVSDNKAVTFTSADQVGEAFGTTSEEYLRAVFYFGFIGKNITSARKLSYVGWFKTATPPRIIGGTANTSLGAYTSKTDVILTLSIDGTPSSTGSLDLSVASNLADVASILEAGISAIGGAYAGSTVTYDAIAKNFTWESALAAKISTLAVEDGGGVDDVIATMGWTNPTYFTGSDGDTVTDMLINSTSQSNNFGSFCFLRGTTDADLLAASVWNTTNNEQFIFVVATDAEAGANDDYVGNAGTAVTAVDLTLDEYPEMCPMIILASTDYSRRNSVVNYMFQRFDLTPLSIGTQLMNTAQSDAFDVKRNNYYAATQTAGQLVAFYQRGYLCGGATDASDQNVFANEIWLKDAAGAAILSLLLALGKVSANTEGRGQLMAVLQSIVDAALNNGTISVGKPITTEQKLFIGQITGDDLAWHQVQNIGYWLEAKVEPYVLNDLTEWRAVYTLVYSKDDDIRKVEGSHVLI